MLRSVSKPGSVPNGAEDLSKAGFWPAELHGAYHIPKNPPTKFREFSGLFEERPSIFRNTKKIPKNKKENRYRFCFGHIFLTMSSINLIH